MAEWFPQAWRLTGQVEELSQEWIRRRRNNFGGNESMKMLEKLILGLGQLVLSLK